MPQNLSTTHEIYMPGLLELDSYWQKAVEDATQDTLKSKKRLNLALKNQQKINQKLEKLGFRSSKCQINDLRSRRVKALSDDDLFRVSSSTTEWESERCDSAISLLSILDDDDYFTHGYTNTHEDTPPGKKYHLPDKPLLGNGSLEKMKRSQNSFNCEPMGMKDSVTVLSQEDSVDKVPNEWNEKNKNLEWLHDSQGNAFRGSDSLVWDRGVMKNNGFKKQATVKDRNYFLDPSTKFRIHTLCASKSETYNTQAKFNSEVLATWTDNQEKENADQRLSLALAKRDIVSKHLKALKMNDSSHVLEVDESHLKNTKKYRKYQKRLPAFTKFYLEVYRELCHKVPIKHIMREAVKRWHRRSKN